MVVVHFNYTGDTYMLHNTHIDNNVELGDYAQVHEFDAEVVAVDKINETCTLEFVNDAGNEETIDVPFHWMTS